MALADPPSAPPAPPPSSSSEELTVEAYAFVVVAVERGEIDRALAALDIQLADLLRIQRTWKRLLSHDAALAEAVERAVAVERRRAP